APHRFAPARADALADQALQDRLDLDAGRVGRRAHHRFRLADGHAVVDGEPQADIVHGIAGLQFAAKTIGALGEGLCVAQPCVSGSRVWIWARSTPRSAPPLTSGRLNASAGMVPEANPTTRCRPRQAIERNACSATSPPTGSKITSGPWPPVNSFSVSRQSALV